MIKYFSEFCINLYKWLRPSNSKGTRPVCNALRRPDHHCVITSLLAAGADDGVPAAPLERVPGSHEGETVQQAGGGPALLSQGAG